MGQKQRAWRAAGRSFYGADQGGTPANAGGDSGGFRQCQPSIVIDWSNYVQRYKYPAKRFEEINDLTHTFTVLLINPAKKVKFVKPRSWRKTNLWSIFASWKTHMEISDVTGNKRPLPQDEAEAESPTSKKSRTDSSPSSLTSSQLAQTLSQKNTQIFIADNSINYLMFDGK